VTGEDREEEGPGEAATATECITRAQELQIHRNPRLTAIFGAYRLHIAMSKPDKSRNEIYG